MSNNSIVAPVNHGDKAPMKKSTLIGILVVVVIVFIIGAAFSSGERQKPEIKPPEPQVEETRVGTGRDVADELEQERLRMAKAPRVEQQPQDTSPANNLPAPKFQSSPANVEAAFDPEAEMRAALAERDARGIASKLKVVDVSSSSNPLLQQGGVAAAGEPSRRAYQPMSAQQLLQQQESLRKDLEKSMGGAVNPSPMITANPRVASTKNWLADITSDKSTIYPRTATGQFLLTQGKTIPAVLLRGINTDLPCELSARTLVDIYDSIQGTALLIPRGSELVGQCSSDVAIGQERVLAAFQRLILPNGTSFDLPNALAMDKSGESGFSANVNNHFFKMFTSSFFVAYLADRAEKNTTVVNTPYSSGQGAQTAAGEVLVDVSRAILDRNKSIPPTLTVKAGARFNVNVAADMDFLQPYED